MANNDVIPDYHKMVVTSTTNHTDNDNQIVNLKGSSVNITLNTNDNLSSSSLLTNGSSSLTFSHPRAISIDSIDDWSASMQTILDQPPARLPQGLIFAGTASMLILLGWAWWGKIDEVGTANGQLVPQGETYKVETIGSGKVSQIEITEGDFVRAGQILVRLDTEVVSQEVQRLEQVLQGYENELQLKGALRDKVSMESRVNQTIAQTELESKQFAIANARKNTSTVQQLLSQQRTDILAYQNKETTLQPLTGWIKQRLEQLQNEKDAHQERLQRLQSLVAQGAISQDAIFEAEATLRQIEQQITQVQMQEIPTAKERVFEVEQSLRRLDQGITQKQGELNSSLSEIQQLELQLAQKKQEKERSLIADRQKIQQLDLEIAQIAGKITDTTNQLASARVKLKQNWLTSPVDGTVLSLNIDNEGKVVNVGETIAEIAPRDSSLILSAMLPNREAGFVEPQMPVKVKLDAYPYQDYGLIQGTVLEVSNDSKQDENFGEAYEVKIALERDYVLNENQQVKFKAGQTATADIVIRRRRILDIFLDPIEKLRQDGINL